MKSDSFWQRFFGTYRFCQNFGRESWSGLIRGVQSGLALAAKFRDMGIGDDRGALCRPNALLVVGQPFSSQ